MSDLAASPDVTTLFYRAFRAHAHGVALLTYRDPDGEPRGMTATSVCALSADPPLLLVCLNRLTRAHQEVEREGEFGVAILARSQRDLASRCAQPGSEKPLDRWCVSDETSRVPRVRDALCWFGCQAAQLSEYGTHSLCIGRIRQIHVGDGDEPLIYYSGYYQTTAPLRQDMRHPRSYDSLRDDMLAMYA